MTFGAAIAAVLQTMPVAAMDQFPEDRHYPSEAADTPGHLESPQAARAAFGNPMSWMQWVESAGYVGSGGGYAGLKQQDTNRPFIFSGGGFNGEVAFTGDYAFICADGQVPAGLDADDVRDSWLLQPASFRFRSIPADIDIYRNGEIEAKCRIFPVDFYGRLRVEPAFEARFTAEMEEWRERCARIDAQPLPYNFSSSARRCFRLLEHESDPAAGHYVFATTVIGDEQGWFEEARYVSRQPAFELPIEIASHFADFSVSDVDYLSDFIDGTETVEILILRNGLYLRAISPEQLQQAN